MSAGAIPGVGGGDVTALDAAALHALLRPASLVPHLQSSLPLHSPAITAPARQNLPINPSASSSLLLMPALSLSPSLPYIGVKTVTSFPLRSPSVAAHYLLLSSLTGLPLASLDGTALTLLRTAALSALAAHFLARPDARTLSMLGAGALAPHLIRAHLFVRPTINRVVIWNRTPSKARALVGRLTEEMGGGDLVFEHGEVLDDVVGAGDVVCCATGARDPIVRGGRIKAGAHLDLVGSFCAGMRECDDEAIARGRVFVDFEEAVGEAGELVGALERGVILRGDVAGTVVDLVGGGVVGRRSLEEVTVFKAVGNAAVDLIAAQLAYESAVRGG